ncbi:acyltransferase family protein [Nocardioides insulae]|uniref:acyltransferase family protein n=1 Tax=Nocardioides insulae TaxID=394734 RepID=UPI00048D1508|nr:acyltransferase [Nocardioides insulae]
MSTAHRVETAVESLVDPPPETGAGFPGLDSLRAVGAIAVLTTHVAFWAGSYTTHGWFGVLLGRLDVGVAIFFVLSGFLLGRPWLTRAAAGRPSPSARPYYWKRLLRIAPLYLLTVVLALGLIHANDGLGPSDWVITLLMLNTFVDPALPAGLSHMWSLAVEVSFYLVLPVLMLALTGRRRLRTTRVLVGLGLLAATSVTWILWVAPELRETSSVMSGQWLPAYLTWFAAGLLIALVQVRVTQGRPARWMTALVTLGGFPGACWAAVAGLLLVCSTPIAGPTFLGTSTGASDLTKHLLYAAIGFLLVLATVFAPARGRYLRAFAHPLARRLGWISYGIFCLHLPLLHFVIWATGWPLFSGRAMAIWLLTVAVSVVAAELAYRFVERPALAWKNRPPRFLRAREDEKASAPVSGTSIR